MDNFVFVIDQEVLLQLERQGLLTFTPSRYVQQKRVVCYDDRYILKLALETDGIVVSNDNYRDLLREDVQYRQVVEQRLLMYSFVNDRYDLENKFTNRLSGIAKQLNLLLSINYPYSAFVFNYSIWR